MRRISQVICVTETVYGLIPAGQKVVSQGNYSDTITVTVTH